ncbi:MAG: rubredoxin [Deltaproteobacteria bacterium]|nr:MAG: rubredoxin [Deltaproteobacteria bacterium]RLB80074.1 MAG: rubredoxin [Deltaproteobacteria bacterium]
MERYVCGICGYVYDPEAGDPTTGIETGTPFNELPYTWVCPICGASKDMFAPDRDEMARFSM